MKTKLDSKSCQFYLREIDRMIKSGKRVYPDDRVFLDKVRPTILQGFELNDQSEESLTKLYQRMTEPKRLKW